MPRSRRRKKKGASRAVARSPQRQPLEAPTQVDAQVIEPHQAQRQKTRTVTQLFEHYQGLLPHPEHMVRFEQILPGTTDRMMVLAEDQSAHRQLMERKYLNFNGWGEILGVVFAGIAGLSGIGAGAFLLYRDKPIGGFGTLLTPLAAIIWAFRKSRDRQAKEHAAKR